MTGPVGAGVEVRAARPDDAPAIVALIRELAAFEGLLEQVRITTADVLRDGFGERPRFECLLAEHAGEPVGFALFFENYSTFEGRRGVFLEDLFVREHVRGRGVGRALIAHLARLVVERDGRRLDLQVLDWNPARAFYDRLGIRPKGPWLPYRLEGEALRALAEGRFRTAGSRAGSGPRSGR